MKRLSYSIGILALSIAFVLPVRGQLVPRTVLLEEGTNWSCGPCALANPGVEAFLQSHGDSIIQIAYHPNWPGPDDPMYMNDENDNQSRVVTYYGISGVPQIEIDGSAIQTASASWDSAFYARSTKLSPIALSVSRSQSGTTVTVNITVQAVGDLTTYKSLKLRVAAVQRYVDTTGPNGEKRYMNPMRAMMPNVNGTTLTMKNGDQKSFTFSYEINDSYRPEKMYEVAFVQNDASKEVVQAASTLESFNVATKSSESPIQFVSGPGTTLNLQIQNTTPEDLTFTATYNPTSGTDWPISLNGQSSVSIPVKKTESGDLQLSVSAGSGAYASGTVLVSAITGRGDTIVTPYSVKFISPTTKLAFVDVSGDSTKSAPTIKSLSTMKYRFVPLSDVEATALQGWNATAFPTMIVEANKWIVTGPNKAMVATYLQSGGHLLIHGGEIAYGLADTGSNASDRDVPFLENTLHATYVQDVASTMNVHGVATDPISSAFASKTIPVNSVNTDGTVQPDVITAVNGGVPIFYYGSGTSQLAGLRWSDGNAQLAYLAFGLQNLTVANRQSIIAAVMNWFGVQASAPEVLQNSFDLGPNYPNPFTAITAIPYSLALDGPVRIAIVDARGVEAAIVANEFESAGAHLATFDGSHLVPGTYFIVMHSAQSAITRAITIE